MNIVAHSYLFLTRALQVAAEESDSATLVANLASEHLDWRQILRLADKEHMTGAFAAALRRWNLRKPLPQPVQAALDRRYIMGGEINSRIKRQAEDAIGTLNDVGITPIILKGGLHLFEASPEDLGSRVLRDLDLLVPVESLDEAVHALRGSGYVPDAEQEAWTYHYRPMYHPDHIVAIELHIRPGEQRHFLSIEEAWAEAVPVAAPGLSWMALGPNHRIAHNIFHSEVQDFGYILAALCLRQLYDLARICQRYKAEINWQEISARMERHGMNALFRARMYQAVQLLGAPRPSIEVDGLRSRFHLSRCLAQLRWPGAVSQIHWLAGVTGPFTNRHLDLIYGCGMKGLAVHVRRFKHAWSLIQSHRGELRTRIAERGRRL